MTNIALLVDGVRPIGAACEITGTPTLEVCAGELREGARESIKHNTPKHPQHSKTCS